jgi:hypothetical protein
VSLVDGEQKMRRVNRILRHVTPEEAANANKTEMMAESFLSAMRHDTHRTCLLYCNFVPCFLPTHQLAVMEVMT